MAKDKPAKKASVDYVVRIRRETRERIRQLAHDKEQLDQTLNRLLDAAEKLSESEIVYTTEIFADVADARGAAILKAVRNKDVPEMPYAIVIISKDEL